MDWVASAILWVGNIVLIKKKRWYVFLIFAAGNIIWAIYWYDKQEWAAFVLVLSFLGQNVWGVYKWKKDEKEVV